MKQLIKKFVPESVKRYRRKLRLESESKYFLERYQAIVEEVKATKGTPRIILIGTSVYGNLGDQAISTAEMKFLEDHYPEQTILEIPNALYFNDSDVLKQNITSSDILLINGGGFLGTLWPEAEEMARDVVSHFKENKVVIMPQTIFFSPDQEGEKELEISKAVYQNHADLTLFVRDQRSYEYANVHLRGGKLTDIYLVPDIVTYINMDQGPAARNQILFCMRRDKEKIDNERQMNLIQDYLAKHNDLPIKYQDTVVEDQLDLYNRKEALDQTFAEFRQSKLVVTDRLHGMIISAITGTPCIALNNISGKVKGQYEWIEYLDYIHYVNDVEAIPQAMDELLSLEESNFNNEPLKQYHDLLAKAIYTVD